MSTTKKTKSESTKTPLKKVVENADHKAEKLSHDFEKVSQEKADLLAPFTAYLENFYKKWPKLPPELISWAQINGWLVALGAGILTVLLLLFYSVPYLIIHLNFINLLSLIQVAATAALLLLAYKPIHAQKAYGWNLLYFSALLNYGLAIVLALINGSVFIFITQILFAVVGFWLIFGLRSGFTKK